MTQELLEKRTGVFDLQEDEPEAVKNMLDFLYDCREALTSPPQGNKESIAESLNMRVRAYVVADKYLVDGMKDLLWEPIIAHFKYLVAKQPQGFLSAGDTMLDLPAIPLAELRTVVGDLVQNDLSSLWKLEGFSDIAAKDGRVAARLLMSVLIESNEVAQAFRPEEVYRCTLAHCNAVFGFAKMARPKNKSTISCPMCTCTAQKIEPDWNLRFTRSLRLSCSYRNCRAPACIVLLCPGHAIHEEKAGTCIFCGIGRRIG